MRLSLKLAFSLISFSALFAVTAIAETLNDCTRNLEGADHVYIRLLKTYLDQRTESSRQVNEQLLRLQKSNSPINPFANSTSRASVQFSSAIENTLNGITQDEWARVQTAVAQLIVEVQVAQNDRSNQQTKTAELTDVRHLHSVEFKDRVSRNPIASITTREKRTFLAVGVNSAYELYEVVDDQLRFLQSLSLAKHENTHSFFASTLEGDYFIATTDTGQLLSYKLNSEKPYFSFVDKTESLKVNSRTEISILRKQDGTNLIASSRHGSVRIHTLSSDGHFVSLIKKARHSRVGLAPLAPKLIETSSGRVFIGIEGEYSFELSELDEIENRANLIYENKFTQKNYSSPNIIETEDSNLLLAFGADEYVRIVEIDLETLTPWHYQYLASGTLKDSPDIFKLEDGRLMVSLTYWVIDNDQLEHRAFSTMQIDRTTKQLKPVSAITQRQVNHDYQFQNAVTFLGQPHLIRISKREFDVLSMRDVTKPPESIFSYLADSPIPHPPEFFRDGKGQLFVAIASGYQFSLIQLTKVLTTTELP